MFFPMIRCTYCSTELEEEETTTPAEDARALMVKFNEQIEPIYQLLKQVEDMRLSRELNEPAPHEYSIGKVRNSAKSPKEERWKEKSSIYDPSDPQIIINMDENDDKPEHKEIPIWMQESTIEGAEAYVILIIYSLYSSTFNLYVFTARFNNNNCPTVKCYKYF